MLKFREISTDDVESVLEDVKVTDDGCYLYPYVMGNGYPHWQKDNKHLLVHRMMKSFDSQIDIPDDMVVHHTCENTNCVNPAHLKVVTPAEHNRIHKTKLTKDDIFYILDKYYDTKVNLKYLSRALLSDGIVVSYSYISKLVNSKVRTDIVELYEKERGINV